MCYCGSGTSVAVPLSGINFSAYAGTDTDFPTDYFVSDSVMPGDDNSLPQPAFDSTIFDEWSYWGEIAFIGPTMDNGGGPGVHSWGSASVQDFVGSPASGYGYGTITQNGGGSNPAYYVHGAIRDKWFQIGSWGAIGWPISDEFTDPSGYRRSDFQTGYICWSSGTGAIAHYGSPSGSCP